MRIFRPDQRYEGVRPINIYLLRLVYILMFFVLEHGTLLSSARWPTSDLRQDARFELSQL
jgi:hypothetical protein